MPVVNKIVRLREVAERKADKRAEKKRELAEHAIMTLAQVGYANTSLRDIAEQSGVSVGVIHYYFEDKVELITYCVQQYKADFVARLDAIMAVDGSRAAVEKAFIDGLAKSIEIDAETHRLWYDIRSQALFDATFHPVVREIESSLISLVGRLLTRLGVGKVDLLDAYLALDNLFRYFLQRKLMGERDAVEEFRAALRRLFGSLNGRRGPFK